MILILCTNHKINKKVKNESGNGPSLIPSTKNLNQNRGRSFIRSFIILEPELGSWEDISNYTNKETKNED